MVVGSLAVTLFGLAVGVTVLTWRAVERYERTDPGGPPRLLAMPMVPLLLVGLGGVLRIRWPEPVDPGRSRGLAVAVVGLSTTVVLALGWWVHAGIGEWRPA